MTQRFRRQAILVTTTRPATLRPSLSSQEQRRTKGFPSRHKRDDWADSDEADPAWNNTALENGDRILSAYILGDERLMDYLGALPLRHYSYGCVGIRPATG